ncbi:hypothetical protein [Georgenia alba]|uniref:CHRD domain-containing protein n=1 Tax=Georgenia alba TaxID=2233858 RepID=A0ABW2Q2S2_9MICO
MSSRFARSGRKWLAAAAATSALVLGGGVATATAGHAAGGDGGGHGGGHEGGGDACEFFLEHMWANEDGIPLLGSFSHVNEHHTDPAYENLVLSLASGAIGNSNMPIIDVYGGPLGWIPVFNPSHVRGHDTDYVTLLTSCGGIGIPLDSNDLTTLNVPSVEELANLSDLIIPGLPTPEMLTDPNYIWETTDASAILERVTPQTLLNLDEYVGFAGDHVDTWRLLWETALEAVTTGDPAGVLEVLQITENINTLESLSSVVGEDAVGDVLNGATLTRVLGDEPLSGVIGEEALTGVLDEETLTELFGEDALSGLLGGEDGLVGGDVLGGIDGLLGGEGGVVGGDGDLLGGIDGLLGGEGGLVGGDGDLLGGIDGLLGGGEAGGGQPGGGDSSSSTDFSVILTGDQSSGAGQCQGTLNGNTLTVTCIYTGMDSEVTSVSLSTGGAGSDLELTANGGTSGGAGGSFELTDEQVAALTSGEYTITVSTSNGTGDISGALEGCGCN